MSYVLTGHIKYVLEYFFIYDDAYVYIDQLVFNWGTRQSIDFHRRETYGIKFA